MKALASLLFAKSSQPEETGKFTLRKSHCSRTPVPTRPYPGISDFEESEFADRQNWTLRPTPPRRRHTVLAVHDRFIHVSP